MKSALDNPEITQAKIDRELQAERQRGPYAEPPMKGLTMSPIGLQPKKEKEEYRLKSHLSHPRGTSINDGIPKVYATIQYANIAQAIKIIKSLGKGCYTAKTDIKICIQDSTIEPGSI